MKIYIKNDLCFQIDKEDFEKIKKHKWHGNKTGEKIYIRSNCRKLYLHRVIMGAKKGMVVDHINGDTLDNRKKNLRNCSHKKNIYNQVAQKRNKTSIYKGVCFAKRERKWRSYISKDGKQYHLGFYKNEKDAANAYDEKAKKLFKGFACLNFN